MHEIDAPGCISVRGLMHPDDRAALMIMKKEAAYRNATRAAELLAQCGEFSGISGRASLQTLADWSMSEECLALLGQYRALQQGGGKNP